MRLSRIVALFAGGMLATPALAQDVVDIAQTDIANSGDTALLLIAAVFGLAVALPGLMLWYAGRLPRAVGDGLVGQAIAVVALVSVLWTIVGYTLAFGEPSGGILGAGNAWMLIGLGVLRADTLASESAFAAYQIVLAVFAAVLMAGAWAGRVRNSWAVVFSGLWSLVVYGPVAHWVWGGGWLSTLGVLDYAGGLVVFGCAGVSGVVAAMVMGKGTAPVHAPGWALPSLIGAGLLWAGWLALAAGSAFAANDDAATSLINLHIGIAIAALVWAGLDRWRNDARDFAGLGWGAASGLAALAPACGFLSPGGALLTGLIAALACRSLSAILKPGGAIDDRMSVFATFGFGGIIGTALVAVFGGAAFGGIGYGPDTGIAAQAMAQLLGIGAVVLWSAVGTVIIGLAVSMLIPMRLAPAEESALAA